MYLFFLFEIINNVVDAPNKNKVMISKNSIIMANSPLAI